MGKDAELNLAIGGEWSVIDSVSRLLEFYEAVGESTGDHKFPQALDMIRDNWRWGDWCVPGKLSHAEKVEIWSKANDERTDNKAAN